MPVSLIEEETGLTVKRMFNLGGTMICHEGLVGGELDVYAEYTGTALTAILGEKAIPDPGMAYNVVSNGYAARFDCVWLEPFGFNNTYAITVSSDAARENGWRDISDLAGQAGDITAGFTAEFMERGDGYPGLGKCYNLEFGDIRDLDPGLMYQAVAQGNVEVICGFATDGRIKAYNLVMLNDDKGFFPPYYAAPVISRAADNRHPVLKEALGLLGGLITDADMRRLNNEVDGKQRDPARVAEEFLAAHGLIGKRAENKGKDI